MPSLNWAVRRLGGLLLVGLVALLGCTCGGGASTRELETASGDVTLYVRVAGNPEGGRVLIATSGVQACPATTC